MEYEELNPEQEKEMLKVYFTYDNWYRAIRNRILNAFDIYKSNVLYGITVETIEEHDEIVFWYKGLLQLNKNSLKNIPQKVKKYLQ